MENSDKLKKYCTYQERSSSEVRQKMAQIGISKEEAETLLTELIDESYVDDARFAECFVRGKMNTKRWGRIKLRSELFKKGIAESLIQQQLAAIDEEEYLCNLKYLADKWRRTNPESDDNQLFRFLLSKGYEFENIKKESKNNN